MHRRRPHHPLLTTTLTRREGLGALCSALASQLNVQLSCPVEAVSYDEGGVRVSVRRPDGSVEVKTADHAVLTLPLGVLQRGSGVRMCLLVVGSHVIFQQ